MLLFSNYNVYETIKVAILLYKMSYEVEDKKSQHADDNVTQYCYLPMWVQRKMRPSWPYMRICQTNSDGDCLFHSVKIILDSVGIHKTIKDLRHICAYPVKNPEDNTTNLTIQTWLEIFQGAYKEKDFLVMHDYQHMADLKDAKWPLTTEDREKLYLAMQKKTFWGEQHCIRVIEEQTQMRFVIFQHETQKPSFMWHHSKNYQQTSFCFLFLSGAHYNPISIHGRYVFEWEKIPYDVQEFLSTGYTQPTSQ